MKYFPPVALAFLLTACAVTPEDQQAVHQRQLEKEARENFIALKSQEHPGRPVVLHDEAPPPTPKPSFISFAPEQQPAAALTPPPAPRRRAKAPTPVAPPLQPYFAARSTPKPRAPHAIDDTVYYWQVPPPGQPLTPHQQAAEAKYARALAKRPADLTPEERLYAHEHY
jgi:hypothetical protein